MRTALSTCVAVSATTLILVSAWAMPSSASEETRATRTSTPKAAQPRFQPPLPQRKPLQNLSILRSRLDADDQLIAMRALHLALTQVPDGGTFVWRKRSRALRGLIKPTKAFRNAQGQVCRHVIYALSLGRYVKQIKGVACRSNDGRWAL